MTDRKARHRKPARLHVGPVFALEGILAILAARHEASEASRRQRGEAGRAGFARTLARRAALAFLVAFAAGALGTQLGIMPARAAVVNGSPAQEEAACSAVLHFHHADAAGWMDGTWPQQQAWNGAWRHAWHAALYADPRLRAEIREYLFTDKRWMAAYTDCGYGS